MNITTRLLHALLKSLAALIRPEVVAVTAECEMAESPLDQVIRRHPADGPVITYHIGQTIDSCKCQSFQVTLLQVYDLQ